MRPLLPLLVLAAALPLRAADDPQPRVLSYFLTVQVDVDAQGHVLKAAAHENGIPVPATTYVRVGMCALPEAEGYRMGLDLKGNGPGGLNSLTGYFAPPHYPDDANRRGLEGEYVVHFTIQDDGRAKVTAIDSDDADGKRHYSWFRKSLNRWVSDMRYQPERVNGRPVPTEMRITASFRTLDGPRPALAEQQADLEAKALTSRECMTAASPAGLVPIAQNSPVTVTPTPEGQPEAGA